MKVIYQNRLYKPKAYNVTNGTILLGVEWVSLDNVQVIEK